MSVTEFHEQDLTGAQINGALFNGSRMRGVEPVDVVISGELRNVVVNGVDIAPLVDAAPQLRQRRLGGPDDPRQRLAMARAGSAMGRGARQLVSEVTRTEPGWPRTEGFPIKECLRIVLNEEWEHRLYAERDLTVLEQGN